MAATSSRPPKKKGDAATSTGSTAQNLSEKTRVRLVGLEAFVELNDQLGTLLSFDGSRGRWQVRLDSGQVKNVRVNNLVNIAPIASEDGKPAKGLKAQTLAPEDGKPARGLKRAFGEAPSLKPQATPLRLRSKSKAKVPEAAPKALVQRPTIPRPNRPAEGPADEGGRSAAKKPKVARDAATPAALAGKKQEEQEEDEDAPLFSDVEELEGEEEVSETSDEDVDEEDDEEFDWEPVGALEMPKVWPREGPKPGQEGFTQQASRCLAQARLGTQRSPFAGLGMRLHQESASFLLHPDSPVERLLVDHATGTGKTLIMLRMLDNYFDDPRPKVAIFPKHAVCDNFYQELLKWPTRWRHFFCFLKPAEASLASGAKDWRRKKFDVWDINNDKSRAEAKTRGVRLEKIIRELTDSIQEALEMRHAIRGGKVTSKFARGFLEEHPDAPMPKAPL
ncbi:Dcun1d2, partial [Symbiodinium sp. CCMP2456]